jgi:hypothetical protein
MKDTYGLGAHGDTKEASVVDVCIRSSVRDKACLLLEYWLLE